MILKEKQLPIYFGPIRGCKWIFGSASGGFGGISVNFNMAEKYMLKVASAIIRSDFTCFDIGANVGLYTLLFSRRAKAVYSFEPSIRNLEYLHRHIRYNHLNNVFVIPAAVSDKNGIGHFNFGDNNATGKLHKTGYPVIKISIDDFCSKISDKPNLIKIDVEGEEYLLLKGARKTLTKKHPLLLISFHGIVNYKKCTRLLIEYGYKHFYPLNAETILGKYPSEFLISLRPIQNSIVNQELIIL